LADRVSLINQGKNPIVGKEPELPELLRDVTEQGKLHATVDSSELADTDIIFINVDTPVNKDHKPDYKALQSACSDLGQVMKRGALVIIESTVSPGTLDRLVRPLLEKGSGYKVNEDFYLGHCPERVMPGKLLANLKDMSRVCGGSSSETSETMICLYREVVQASLDACDNVTAELVKTMENAYRDVNIAFANEAALICERMGADIWEVREMVNKSPGRDLLLPGGGVGGHCIPKDPWLLIANVEPLVDISLIPIARKVNDSMPAHVADLTCETLDSNARGIKDAKIAVLGYSYLENSGDTRNSPSEALVHELKGRGGVVAIHDPYVKEFSGGVDQVITAADAIVLMVGHDLYRNMDLTALRKKVNEPIIIDARNIIDGKTATQAGFKYVLLGSRRGNID
jgi:UDP-N-acetyl-D-mannosaminuronic acid dehydrogenase